MTEKRPVVGTSPGTPLTDDDTHRLADEAETGYDPSRLRRRGGRPRMGSAPAEVVPVHLDPDSAQRWKPAPPPSRPRPAR